MSGILADHNCAGHLRRLIFMLESDEWREVWRFLDLKAESFESLQLPASMNDRELWRLCHERQFVLLTGNRNAEGADSLEAVLRDSLTADSLPVFTIGDPERVLREDAYAERVVETLLEHLLEIEKARGVGRIYLP